MKISLVLKILFFFVLIFFSHKNYSAIIFEANSDTSICLEISGKVKLATKPTSSKKIKVELIYYNSVIDSSIVKIGKTFKFYLKKDAVYTLRISKPGYITRVVTIYTNVKKFEPNEEFYKFFFDTELLPDLATEILDAEVLEFPIAIISYSEKLKGFSINDKYTKNIKKESFQK
jgi:hypothetical protein